MRDTATNNAPQLAPATAQLSPWTKLLYGAGDTGFSLTGTIIGAYFLIVLTDVVGVPPAVAAIAIFVGRTWDYVNDPIIGHISDRTRTRWGRRRPFLLFGALPFALAFTLLWWRPPVDNLALLTAYYALAYVLFDTSATFVYMPYFALTPELTAGYDERTSLTSYRMFFSILGSLVAFTIPLLIIGKLEPRNAPRVLIMGLIFGLVSAAPLLLVFFGTRERPEFMQQARPALRDSLRAALHNRVFLLGLLIFLLTWVSVEILQVTLLYFIKYVVQREPHSDLVMATIFVTAILTLPLWNWASRRWGKRSAYIVGIAFWAAVQVGLILLNPFTPLAVLIGICFLAGIGVAAAHVLPWSMIPDAVEWGEWQTGERHEGMLYSLVTLVYKATASLAIPVVGLILQFTGYAPNAAQQPPSALLGIRLAVGPLPALLLCLGILVARRYPLTRATYAQVARDLAERRTAAIAAEAR